MSHDESMQHVPAQKSPTYDIRECGLRRTEPLESGIGGRAGPTLGPWPRAFQG